jgi:type IV pilus assembly protein PilQ
LGRGLVAALIFIDNEGNHLIDLCDKVAEKAFQNGLLVVHTGRESIKLAPPLSINEEALIEDGTEVPYNTVAQAGSTPTTEFKTAALTLKVTPQIIDDGNIYLDVEVNKDTPLAGTSPPAISTKQLKTKLLIKDGGVALIGGITQTEKTNAEDGVPFLKDLPFIGNLFKSNKNKNNKNTLYIFIAPEVI